MTLAATIHFLDSQNKCELIALGGATTALFVTAKILKK